tara:strand:+ start:8994 stop:10106 length:1113 start_codon:yes stop_codon:yes gene_type:complete
MGTLKVDTVTNVAGSGAPNATAVTVDNVALSSIPQMEYVASASAPTSPSVGSLWYSTTSDVFYMYDGTSWNTITFTSPPPAYLGARGICAGGLGYGNYYNVIDYITITNSGNATDFGDLDRVVSGLGGGSNGSRGITAGGVFDASHINYITISNTGNSSSFGDLTTPRSYISGLANKTRAVFGGGTNTSTNQVDLTMDYITVATTGNATDFGDINSGTYSSDAGYGATNSKTRGLFAASGLVSKTYYITIDTPSNATEFGDLSDSRAGVAACTDGSRAVISGSQSDATIDYVEIATTGNATNFGDMDQNVSKLTGTGDGTTGVFMGGYRTSFGGQAVNFIQKLTVQTPANATDFGDLTEARQNCCGFSGD